MEMKQTETQRVRLNKIESGERRLQDKYFRLDEFDAIGRINLDGVCYWMLSDLAPLLGYSQNSVKTVLHRAMVNCRLNRDTVDEHFIRVNRSADFEADAKTNKDYLLTRYACLLLLNNCDQRKDGVALGKVYFAQEGNFSDYIQAFAGYDESSRRLIIKKEIRQWNQMLADAANTAGITMYDQYAVFQSAGYMGLYEMNAESIRRMRALPTREAIPEFMGSAELILNLLRISQTALRLKRDDVKSADDAIFTHILVGREIRAFLKRIGGTMPEDYPSPALSAAELEREQIGILRHKESLKPPGLNPQGGQAAKGTEFPGIA